jgi:hypothetical protein
MVNLVKGFKTLMNCGFQTAFHNFVELVLSSNLAALIEFLKFSTFNAVFF